MTRYKSFQDIQERDKDLAQYFLQPDMAVDWIMGITNGIAKWVADKRDKGLWEVVRFVSYKRGVISKPLSREKFAKLVCTYCKEALKEGETYTKLRQSMEQSKYIPEIKTYDKLPDSHRLRAIVADIEHFFDERDFEPSSEQSTPSISERLETYLRNIVDVESKVSFCRIFVNPDYGNGINPNIAIERYHSKTLLNTRKPWSIEAYECISGALNLKTLYAYIGLYEGRRKFHLSIVSTYGVSNDVYNVAMEKEIGYVRINPNKEMKDDSYAFDREIADTPASEYNICMLLGNQKMRKPLVVLDGPYISTSLAFILKEHGFKIKSRYLFSAPHITYDEIEAKADELTKAHVEKCKQTIKDAHGQLFVENSKIYGMPEDGITIVELPKFREYLDLSINPFTMAEELGLRYEVKELSPSLLGRIDLRSQTVTINEYGCENYERTRFTMAHELGHYVIHIPLINDMGIDSFDETVDTMDNAISMGEEDKMWLERHANYYASCFLMPRQLVITLYDILYDHFITKKSGDPLGPLYYNEKQRETWDNYNDIVGGMAKIMNVSVTAMKLRLVRLKLLIEA